MAKPNVSEVIVQTLETAGVDAIYGVVGDSLNGITDSLLKHKTIRWVHVRHEEVAAFAAAGSAHVTGKLAVCAGSCGPGNLHLINGLYDAHRSRVPVLAIAAQIPSPELGSGYFQETRPEALFRECSHYCETISSPEQAPRLVELAIRAAVGQRGVAVIVIPGDVALKTAVTTAISAKSALLPKAPRVIPSEDELSALASLLKSGKKVTLLAGRGCAGAHKQLLKLADALKAPIVHALGGKEHVEYDNPYDVGMTELIGFSSGYHTLMAADVVLMLGTEHCELAAGHYAVTTIDLPLSGRIHQASAACPWACSACTQRVASGSGRVTISGGSRVIPRTTPGRRPAPRGRPWARHVAGRPPPVRRAHGARGGGPAPPRVGD